MRWGCERGGSRGESGAVRRERIPDDSAEDGDVVDGLECRKWGSR